MRLPGVTLSGRSSAVVHRRYVTRHCCSSTSSYAWVCCFFPCLPCCMCSTLPVVLHLPMRANLPRCATLCRLLLMPMLGGRRAGAGWSRLSGDSHKDRMGIIGQFLSQLKNTNVSFVDDSFLTPYPIIETTSVSTLGLP